MLKSAKSQMPAPMHSNTTEVQRLEINCVFRAVTLLVLVQSLSNTFLLKKLGKGSEGQKAGKNHILLLHTEFICFYTGFVTIIRGC